MEAAMRGRKLLLSGTFLAAAAAIGAGLLSANLPAARAEGAPQVVPPPAVDLPASGGRQVATLSGGCFWGVQGIFEHVRGVEKAVSGYAGGPAEMANYRTVSTGMTGHAETVQITYDPAQISYGRILQIFFSVALDPTEVDGQGPDEGTQYRSEIWTADAEQARAARAYIAQLGAAHIWRDPIATRVDPLVAFYPAEDYHQDYLDRHPNQPYIAFYDIPKVRALARLFPEAWRPDPVTVLTLK
jgi:peptide-methionine (S)-S-oxide reductase